MVNSSPRTELLIFLLAVAVHLATAWFSSGYYAADEHYQIITFAEVKAGHEPVEALPWEHAARIRSVVLPAVCLVLFSAADTVGLHDPFHKAFLLRLLTTLAALVIVRRWTKVAMPLVAVNLRITFLLLTWLLWFLPFQHVRFSSETWSGLFFLLGLAGMLSASKRNFTWLFVGFLFGFCVMIKPSMLMACIGAIAWSLVGGQERYTIVLRILLGGLLALGVGLLVDSWFYGEFTPTFWNYLHKNALSILRVRPLPVAVEAFPWFYYFPLIMKYGIWPIGTVLLVGLFWLTFRKPRSLFVWCIWSYLFMLSLVPHKELRFLFPLADLAPAMLVLAWQELRYTALFDRSKKPAQRALLAGAWGLLATNLIGLVVAGTTAAGSGRTRLAAALGPVLPNIQYVAKPDEVWKIAIPEFYGGPPRPLERKLAPCLDLSVVIVSRTRPECPGRTFERIARAEPAWASTLLRWYDWRPADRGWAAYRMVPTK